MYLFMYVCIYMFILYFYIDIDIVILYSKGPYGGTKRQNLPRLVVWAIQYWLRSSELESQWLLPVKEE